MYKRDGNPEISERKLLPPQCSASNVLAALMWRRPLNNVALATSTHRRLEGVSDEISTQVIA